MGIWPDSYAKDTVEPVWESDLEPVLERVRQAAQEARRLAELGSWGPAYEALYRGSLTLSSIFEDDTSGPSDPLEAVLRTFIRTEASVHSMATSENGMRSIEKTLRQAATDAGAVGDLPVWWVHDGSLPTHNSREAGLWLAARSWGSSKTKDRLARGRWTNGKTVKAVLLVNGPQWMYEWMRAATDATGVAVIEKDPEISWYIPHLWRSERDHRYFDLSAVHSVAVKLVRASKKPSGLDQAETSGRVDGKPQRTAGDAGGNILENLGAP